MLWNVLSYGLIATSLVLTAISYLLFTRQANKIPIPDLPEFEPGDSAVRYLDTLVVQAERYQQRTAIRTRAIRLNYVAMGTAALAVLISAAHLVAILF